MGLVLRIIATMVAKLPPHCQIGSVSGKRNGLEFFCWHSGQLLPGRGLIFGDSQILEGRVIRPSISIAARRLLFR